MMSTVVFGYVRQMDLNFKEVRIRAGNSADAALIFHGKYAAKVRGLEDALKLALRMSDPVQIVVENRVIVKAVNIPVPE